MAPPANPNYKITIGDMENGTVTANPTTAKAGATVTLTPVPDEGYALSTLTVTDRDGEERKLTEKSENKYTFTMPDTSVTVEATFVEEGAVTLPFTDVKESDWYYEAVCYTYEHHMMTGTSDTQFAPAANLTRGMIAQVLYNLEEKPAAAGTSFVDVPSRRLVCQGGQLGGLRRHRGRLRQRQVRPRGPGHPGADGTHSLSLCPEQRPGLYRGLGISFELFRRQPDQRICL